jgi:Tol biopolymer transport system component
LTITDGFGHTTAPISETIAGDIPGVTYSFLGTDSHLAVVPKAADKTYTVTLRSGATPLALTLTEGTGITATQAIRYRDLALPVNVVAMLQITPQGIGLLRYDSDGNGSVETTVMPIIAVHGAAANDLNAPTIAMNKMGQLSALHITLSAQDVGSGVRALYYSLDGTNYRQYTAPLQIDATQTPNLYVFADDNVANRSRLVTYQLARRVYLPMTVRNGVSTVPPPINRLAFRSTRDGNEEIYTMSPDGTNLRRLTDDPAPDARSSWSPDGRLIAFESWYRDGTGDWEVYVMNADGSNPHNLTHNPSWDSSPAWSPDGRSIAFQSHRTGNLEIYVMNMDGTAPRNLTQYPGADDVNPAWAPDGRFIAFRASRDGDSEIYVMNADGTNQRNITKEPADDDLAAWSPDGRSIAFQSQRNGNWEIYVMNADGTNLRRLTQHAANDIAPTWSPDGRSIAFQSQRNGNWEIYVMNADGTNLRRLTQHAADDEFPSWSPR